MIKLFRATMLCIAAVLVSCSTDDGKPQDDVPMTEEITISKGATKQLELADTPDGTDVSVIWVSSSPNVVTVDDSGVIRGVAMGTAFVIATPENGNIQKWTITVEDQVSEGPGFITTWDATEITIPTNPDLIYSYDVDWDNDGTVDETGLTGDASHTFDTPGEHTVRITGTFPAINFLRSSSVSGNKDKIISVDQWGTGAWLSMETAFYFCRNLKILATDIPDLSNVTNMAGMFYAAWEANPDVSKWDVSNVTDMTLMFAFTKSANPDVSDWDVTNVTNMERMFKEAIAAKSDVSSWNVSNVTNMSGMFSGIKSWTPDVSNWEVSSVTDMRRMFEASTDTNPDVSNWDVASVTNMSNMFRGAAAVTPDVSKWNVANVTDMNSMFEAAIVANPEVSGWDVSNVTNMMGMFRGAKEANPDVSSWIVAKVTDMSSMFEAAISANPNVAEWNVSNLVNMENIFKDTPMANLDVTNWDVSKVTNMSFAFAGTGAANPDVSKWDIGSVTKMDGLVAGADSFTKESYEKLLINFASNSRPQNVVFEVRQDLIATSTDAVAARKTLVDNSSWIIIDGSNPTP